MPSILRDHPLRGKRVCRKCHSECRYCYNDGSMNCYECNNLLSSNGSCVSQCNKANEYLNETLKVSSNSCSLQIKILTVMMFSII